MNIFHKKLFFVLLFCIIIQPLGLAQSKRLQVYSDYAVFYSANNEINSYIEVYFSYPDNSYTLVYNKTDSTYRGDLLFDVTITDNTGRTVVRDKWNAPFKQQSLADYTPQDFYGLRRYYIEAGEYSLNFAATDMNGNRETSSKHNINIKPFSNKLSLSSLQIANKVAFAGDGLVLTGGPTELFLKNQHYVYPNPQREISADIPTLHLYSEIYGAQTDSIDTLMLTYKIRNAKEEVVFEYTKRKPAIANAIVETIALPLDAIATGVYTVSLTVEQVSTLKNSQKASSQSRARGSNTFYLINSNIDADVRTYYTEDEMFDLSEFATYTLERADLEYAQSKVLATQPEINTWEKLTDLKAKQRFLFRFWYTRNPDADNSFNIRLAEFRSNVKYVNTYYSYGGNYDNGWQTDRGEIYITFGEPDYKEEVPGSAVEKPYQVWTYHAIEGGATFVFVDNMGLGNFRLVHSTHSAYIHNYNWQRLINSTTNYNEY